MTEGSSLLPPPVAFQNYQGLNIETPLDLLLLLDDNIVKGAKNGGIDLYPWQIQFLLDFATGGQSDKAPFQALVRAANGSGKDKYVIAPCVVWLCMRYQKARGVVTSSSGVQLDNQTDTYINQLCIKVNALFGGQIWKCNYRYYECLATGSPILLFATDEAGKAEGYHPLEPNAPMGLFESEAKTVPDDINTAFNKCTGYTHRVLVSSPGSYNGHFYQYCSTAVSRKDIEKVTDVRPIDWIEYHITAHDCAAHLHPSYIEQMKRDLPGHENGIAFRSQVLAEFGGSEGMVVISSNHIRKCCLNPGIWVKEKFNKGGLDLSDGGDETVLVIRNGNRHIATEPFRFDNTEDTIAYLEELFIKWQLNNPESFIFSDAGGLGKPMLDRLKRKGWSNIRYMDNRGTPLRPKTYKNRGAELWFHLGHLIERGEIIIQDDNANVLSRQLGTRYYKILDGAVHQLLSKIEARAKGFPSPDRADAFVLAFTDYKSTFMEIPKDHEVPFEETPDSKANKEKPVGDFDLKSWAFKGSKKAIYVPKKHEPDDDLREQLALINKGIKRK